MQLPTHTHLLRVFVPHQASPQLQPRQQGNTASKNHFTHQISAFWGRKIPQTALWVYGFPLWEDGKGG